VVTTALMPIYEYRCEKCGDFELTQRISDPPAQRCPKCRRKVRRLISSTSFQLKGSGWYVTDYARAGKKKGGDAAANGTPAGGTSETKPAAKSETKSEAKTATKSSGSGAAAGSGGKS
jgi:putative FmdB family regulatory protein